MADGQGGAIGRSCGGLGARRRRRSLWREIHLWAGLILGGFLTVFGVTGAVLVFHSEIDHALNPKFFTAPTAPAATGRRPLQDIIDAGLAAAPGGWQGASLIVPDSAEGNFVFAFGYDEPTPPPEEAVDLNLAIDPHSADVVGRRTFYHAWSPLRHCFVGFFFKLHYAMFLGDFGTAVVGYMALVLIVTSLVGLLLWWPLDGRWRRVLTIKRHASTLRFNYDLHQTSGFYTLLVLLAVLLSGTYFNLNREFEAAVGAFSELTPPLGKHAADRDRGALAADELLRSAVAAHPGGKLNFVAFGDPGLHQLEFCFKEVPMAMPGIVDSRCIVMDRHTGRILRVTDPEHGSAGDSFIQWQWPLHSGQAFGWTGRILVFVCGLVCPVLFVTGFIRWRQRRRARQQARS